MTALLWLAANWRVVALASLIAVPSLYAAVMKHQRDSARETIKEMVLAGRRQEERTKQKIESDKRTKEQADNDYKLRIERLNNLASRQHDELQQSARSGVVPAVPASAASSGGAAQQHADVICFSRERLSAAIDAELSAFAERYAASLHAGASAIAGFKACAAWSLEESAKQRAPAAPAR